MLLLSSKIFRYLEQLGFQKYRDDMKIKCFYNMAKKFVTFSKSKGKVSNDQNKFQDCLMTIILHTPLQMFARLDFYQKRYHLICIS